MKIFGLKFFIGIFALAGLFASVANADLVWTKDRGWQVQGGVFSGVFGSNVNVETALQAMNEAQSAIDAEENFDAIEIYKQIVHNYANSIFAPEAYFQLGVLYSQEGMFIDSYECFENIIKFYPDYPKFNLVIGKEFELATKMKDGQTYYLWGWLPWITDEKDVIKIYESTISNAPFGDYAPLALMSLALYADDKGKPEVAIDALDRLINTYPQNMFVPDAYLQMAYTYRKMADGPEYDQASILKAVDYYQDFLILFPEHNETPTAEAGLELMMDVHARSRLCMGDFYYYYRNNMQAAAIFYNETITLAPNSLAAKEAESQLKKIADDELPPMTPADWFMGRCDPPTGFGFEGTQQIVKLDSRDFVAKSSKDFMETVENLEAQKALADSIVIDSVDGVLLSDKINEEGFVGE